MDKDRRLSYLILKDIEDNKSWSKLSIAKHIEKEEANSPAFIRELVYGVLRNTYLLDYNIDLFLKKPKIGVSERIWLRMGFYQLSLMDGVTDYAAINETCELAKKFKKGTEGFINAVLRNFQRKGSILVTPDKQENIENFLSIKYSTHVEIVKLWLKSYGLKQTEELLCASNTPAPLCIRVNTLKITKEELSAKLQGQGFDVQNGSLSDKALIIKGSGLLDTAEYKNGYFSVQGESSQYAISILNPKPGSVVLDLCAAPGGKSCAMAELMENQGEVLSFDYYEHRTALIEKERDRLGLSIIKASQADSSVFNKDFEGKADFVLCDVPCSGLGTLRENPEIKFRPVDTIDVQRTILENALRYVKPGGYVLYSTCTLNPQENNEVCKNYNIEFEKQIFTTAQGPDGFYICKIRR